MVKSIAVLGSTGSIGRQTLDVARNLHIPVAALAARKNIGLLERQIREFRPAVAAVEDCSAAAELKVKAADTDTKILAGTDGVCEAAGYPAAGTVVNAVVGIAGLKPSLAAIDAGHDIALANKETLVTAGELVKQKLRENRVRLLPVDSEHSAIFQCLCGIPEGGVKKILLTCSGGPFYGMSRERLASVTAADALKHPNWEMGEKITVDCATLMNKGFEIIEAVHLFSVKPRDVEVLIHRQSIVHSAVELRDGAVLAQLAQPDMRLPIQYALTFPERHGGCCEALDLTEIGTLTFSKPDLKTFDCLKICTDAAEEGGLKPAAANGADERAVALFLEGKIGFLQIAEAVRGAVENQPAVSEFSLGDVFEADRAARDYVSRYAEGGK